MRNTVLTSLCHDQYIYSETLSVTFNPELLSFVYENASCLSFEPLNNEHAK